MKELELTVNRFEQAGVKVNGFILNDIQRAGAGTGMDTIIHMLTKQIKMIKNPSHNNHLKKPDLKSGFYR